GLRVKLAHLVRDIAHVARRYDVHLELPRLHARRVEQVLRHSGEPIDLPIDDYDGTANVRLGRQPLFTEEPLRGGSHRGQGVAQVVRYPGEETELRLAPMLELGDHRVERRGERPELVVGIDVDAPIQVARGDAVCLQLETTHVLGEPPGT